VLGRGVEHVVRRQHAGQAGDHQDAARGAGQVRQPGLDPEDDGVEVDRHRPPVPRLVEAGAEPRAAGHPRIEAEHVQPPERAGAGPDRRRGRAGLCEVSGHEDTADLGGDPGARHRVDVDDRHLVPGGREPAHERGPDPARPAGDQRRPLSHRPAAGPSRGPSAG
jgi:hypothetical protein